MNHLIALLALLLATQIAKAQTLIQGKVQDSKNRPLAGASIAVKDSYDGATTDSTGSFRFKTTEKGNAVLLISSIGYKLQEKTVVLNGTALELTIVLKEEPNELTAVVISAGSFEASDRKRAAAILNPIDIVTTASANGDITGALKTLPGAQQVGEREGLFVRGGTAAETKTFIDGTLVNNFFFTGAPNIAAFSRFSPFIFKGTVFSTGGYSALYGQALSSAVILESIDLPEQSAANINVSVLGIGAGFQQLSKKKNSSWGLNYGYNNLGPAFAVFKQRQDYSQAPEYHNSDANFRIKTSKNGFLKYYGYYNTNRLDFTSPSVDTTGYYDRFALKNQNTYHNLMWRDNLSKKWKIQTGVSYSINKDDIHSELKDASGAKVTLAGMEFKEFTVKNRSQYFNAKLVLDRKLKGLSALRFGSEYNYSNDETDYTAYNGTNFKSEVKEHLNSFFAESDMYITNDIAAKIGIRTEHSALLNKWNIAPRASLAYKFSKEAQASLAYGVFYQNPEKSLLPTNAALTFSRATHYIAQYLKTTSKQSFRLEAFYKKYDNLYKTSVVFGTNKAINNDGFGEAKGIELFWRDKQTVKNLDYWISYSYLDTKRDYLNYPSAIQPNFAAKHTASLVIKKFMSALKTNLNIAYNFNSGRPYYNILPDNNGNYKLTDQGTTPAFNNVSLGLNYLPFIGKKNRKIYDVYVLQVNNIFNLKQVYGYQYSYNGIRKQAILPPSRMFVFIGAFISIGVDRSDEVINNGL